jgi:hypothetical protein
MKNLIKIIVSLAIFAALLAVALTWAANLGVEACGLEDTYNNCLNSQYEIEGKQVLTVTEPPKQQQGVNVVQVTAPNYYLVEGEL